MLKNLLKEILRKIPVIVTLIIVKSYIDLDLIHELVDNLIISISAFFWDFNPFSSEITKVFFNGNSSGEDETRVPISSILNPDTSGEEGEGSNRQNNPQGSDINSEEVKEVEGGVVVSGETLEEIKSLYEKNSEFVGKMDEISDEIEKVDAEGKRLIKEETQIMEKRAADIEERMKDYEEWCQSDERLPGLSDMKRKIDEDVKAFDEDTKKIREKLDAHKAEINKRYLDLLSAAAQKMKDSTNESNSK
jgi:hypothetical protein